MATTSITKNRVAPKKRSEGLAIAFRALVAAKTPLGAGAFYALFIALIVGLIYPTLSSINFNSYLTSNAVAGLVGAKLQSANSFAALMSLELYGSFYGLLFGGIIAYIAGSALPVTIENGTIDLALSRPISRTRYYLELWLSANLGGLIMAVLSAFAVWLSTLFVSNANIDWGWLVITQLIEFAFLFMATGIGMLFGSFMSASRAAGGAAVGIIGLAYLMNTTGNLADKLSWMLKIEPFYYTQGVQALAEHSITGWYPWVLVAAGLVCGIVGLVVFQQRDLPTT
ncbi:MAG TPA: ABC transporter permease subunit [Ktedonobacteraceae bacterium]|nr:ABC transporter permease subunit [Ktedonobacteraceae bacterium]